MAEVGYQQVMLGQYETAYLTYQRATQLDENNMSPLYGMIYCRVKQEMLEDAEQQLEFLNEIGETTTKTAEHVFLEAIIEWRRKGNRENSIRLLDQALNLHISSTKSASGNLEFYIKLNADFLM
jgi:tetratricopeptide repeat protein 21B